MRIIPWIAGVCLGLGVLAANAQSASHEQVSRGKYLVENVAGCGDCHTPINERGEQVKEKTLQGATLVFKPTFPIPNWVEKAPNLTALKGWTDGDLVKFLMTGLQPNGQPANPPMPSYRLNKEDAEAVTAYVRSLGPDPSGTEAHK